VGLGRVQTTLFRWSPRPWHGSAHAAEALGADITEPGRVVIFPTAKSRFPGSFARGARDGGPASRFYNLGPVALRRGANISQRATCAPARMISCAGTCRS